MLFTWIKNHLKELSIVILAFLFMLWSPNLIRLYDPTAGELDGSVLQLLAHAGLMFFGSLLSFWVALSAFFPTVSSYADAKFKADFTSLPAVHRVWLFVAVLFLFVLLACVCVLAAHIL